VVSLHLALFLYAWCLHILENNLVVVKTLVIGDIHEKIWWVENIIKKESPDLVITMGDYFDSFITTEETVKATCDWLRNSLSQKNRISLIGNHELFYRFPLVKHFVCSGNTMAKCELINNILTVDDWDKLNLFHFDGKYLYSHAGISKEHFEHPVNGITLDGIKEKCDKAIERAKSGGADPILRAGWSRGGMEKTGGITWQDQNCESKAINGWFQFVGHTPYRATNVPGRIKYVPNKKDALGSIECLDFCGRYYTTITDGKIEYKLTGSTTYNEHEHKLVGEPFIDTRKIIEYCKACGDPAPCHNTHRID